MDLEIREFSHAIIKFVDASELPVEVKRLCLKDIYNQLDEASTQEIQRQIAERDKAEAEKKQEALAGDSEAKPDE